MTAPFSPLLKLNDGVSIPQFGLGVYQSTPGPETYDAVLAALKDGYRHIDTAAIYRNEEDVGRAVRDSGIPREEIFITTKFFASSGLGYDKVIAACKSSLKKLGLAYVDLYLVHSPGAHDLPARAATWRGMEELHKEKLARSIGVSNYAVHHLEHLFQSATVAPSVNQIELSPYRNLVDIVAYCKQKGIAVEAYSPLTKGEKLKDPRLVALAAKYKKTPAQLLIRFAIDNGWIVIPKSVHPARIHENRLVFDFAIDAADLEEMRTWEENLVTGWDPTAQP